MVIFSILIINEDSKMLLVYWWGLKDVFEVNNKMREGKIVVFLLTLKMEDIYKIAEILI